MGLAASFTRTRACMINCPPKVTFTSLLLADRDPVFSIIDGNSCPSRMSFSAAHSPCNCVNVRDWTCSKSDRVKSAAPGAGGVPGATLHGALADAPSDCAVPPVTDPGLEIDTRRSVSYARPLPGVVRNSAGQGLP